MRNTAKKTLEVLESFFGGLMLLPKPGTTPDTISSVFSSLRARALDSNECYSFTRLVSYKAKVALLAAMDLYKAFLFSQGPSSRLKRVYAFNLYYY
ncbi:hypothetical protein F4678DRAFT_468667 [Xylaria arbuscula]|nr:hypothetical protein F4678DRAFT_468667 [Xylaria arbuscula]